MLRPAISVYPWPTDNLIIDVRVLSEVNDPILVVLDAMAILISIIQLSN